MKKFLNRGRNLVLSSAARSTYVLFAGNLLDSVFAFLFTIFTFKLLSTSQFGIFSALNNFIFTSASVLDMGIGLALLHFLARFKEDVYESRQYFNTSLLVRLLLAASFSLVVILFSKFLAPLFFRTSDTFAVIIAAVAIITVSLHDVLNFSLQGQHRFFASAVVNDSFSFLRFFLVFIFLLTKATYSLDSAILINFLGPLVGIVLALKLLKVSSLHLPRPRELTNLLKFSGGMGVYKIASTIAMRLDIQMVLLFLGAAAAGVYSVASRLANFYPVILISLTSILASRISTRSNLPQLHKFIRKSLFAIGFLLLCMAFGILVAHPFIVLLFGASAGPAVPFFQKLTLAYVPQVISCLPFALLVYYFHRPNIAAALGLVQLTVTLLGNLILVPLLGADGSIFAFMTANLLVLLLNLAIVSKLWKLASSAPVLPV